ncbi:MAG TPA: protein-S-isoprenylcysteine methyltransferase [Gammaproteobacteria bacterium]|nr:protein-S-isoprenylcysteine methyltransferase [Gammaproteobacteria bacterium]
MSAGLLMLAALWAGWCALHSLLASLHVHRWLRRRLGPAYRYYRLFYNAFAVFSLLPVLAYGRRLQEAPFLAWHGGWHLLQGLMIAGALYLFIAPLRHYDMSRFLGLQQLSGEVDGAGLDGGGEFCTAGILGRCRHPWYSGALLLIWARDLDGATLVTNVVLSLYLVLGARLEERKLLAEFGDAYRRYRQAVPMFIPRWRS